MDSARRDCDSPRNNDPDQGGANATTEDRTDVDSGAGQTNVVDRHHGLVQIFPRSLDRAAPTWRIHEGASLGRGDAAVVKIPDRRISRVHARLDLRPGGLFVDDGGSRHGSFVNGHRLMTSGMLAAPGSVLRFGDTLLLFVDDLQRYTSAPRRIKGDTLGLPCDVLGGPKLADIWDHAARLGRLSEPTLILGETGSGKESIARIIHRHRESPGPFVGINMAAVPAALFEAELFGFERGAFTGATAPKLGAFREAEDGVLFLDEVGDLPAETQAKLLRAMDLHRIRPLGAGRDVVSNARIVSATSRDLRAECQAGRFRTDLWYRLAGTVLTVPPLRDRPDDIVLLALQVLADHGDTLSLSADAVEILLLAEWEGNARQARHVVGTTIDTALAQGSRQLQPAHLPDLPPRKPGDGALTAERIQMAMLKSGGVVSRAARLLGVSRTTFYATLKRLNWTGDFGIEH